MPQSTYMREIDKFLLANYIELKEIRISIHALKLYRIYLIL